MDSPSEDGVKVKKRGRPKKSDLGADDRASSSSRDASAPPTPAGPGAGASASADELDPLTAQELALFGVAGTEEILPPAPADGVLPAALATANGHGHGQAGAKRSIGAADPTAPLGRAKRPKNVKFRCVRPSGPSFGHAQADLRALSLSPAKGGKALARRSMATGGTSKSNGANDGEASSLVRLLAWDSRAHRSSHLSE